MIQDILMYIVLLIAVGYLVKKFLLPRSLFSTGKEASACGKDDCGCH